MSTLQEMTEEFVQKLVEHTAIEMHSRAMTRINEAFGGKLPLSLPAKSKDVFFKSMEAQNTIKPQKKVVKPRKKQLCPVPNCKGLAAPIFGMVCSKHKAVAKSKIAKYRKLRIIKQKLSKAKKSK